MIGATASPGPRLARPRRAVGGHRQGPRAGAPREHLDKPLHLAARERLAAVRRSSTPRFTDKDPREALDLLTGESTLRGPALATVPLPRKRP